MTMQHSLCNTLLDTNSNVILSCVRYNNIKIATFTNLWYYCKLRFTGNELIKEK